MKNIEKWLQENNIEYVRHQYGNGDYFNDNFCVPGLQIAFYFDNIGNPREKEAELVRYMSRKKAYICKYERFGVGYTYRIMTVFDATRLREHEKRVDSAAQAFWQEEHVHRIKNSAAV